MTIPFFRPKPARALALGLFAIIALACGTASDEPPAPQEPPVANVAAGVGLKTIVGAAFTPQSITVPIGSTVAWTIASDEPHQVTFFASASATPEGSARQWARTVELGSTTPVDGSTFLHTGVLNRDEKVSFTFSKIGNFRYLCPIHQGMEGTVEVVAAGKDYTTEAEATAAAKKESEALLSKVEPMRKDAISRATREALTNGASRWIVTTGPKVPTDTGYLEIKEYFPPELKIKAGDTVRWVFESSHSVTFLPPGEQLPTPAPPATRPSDAYDGKSLYTSAVPARPANGSNPTWELTFSTAGTYTFICQLHYARLGHIGTLIVE